MLTPAEVLDAIRRRGGRLTMLGLMCATDRGGAAADGALRRLVADGVITMSGGDGLEEVIALVVASNAVPQLDLFTSRSP